MAAWKESCCDKIRTTGIKKSAKKVYLIEKENATESFVDIWHLIFRGCWCNQEAESPPSCLHNLSSLSWRMFPSYKKRSRQNKAPAPQKPCIGPKIPFHHGKKIKIPHLIFSKIANRIKEYRNHIGNYYVSCKSPRCKSQASQKNTVPKGSPKKSYAHRTSILL